jgi:hypothetical protein
MHAFHAAVNFVHPFEGATAAEPPIHAIQGEDFHAPVVASGNQVVPAAAHGSNSALVDSFEPLCASEAFEIRTKNEKWMILFYTETLE